MVKVRDIHTIIDIAKGSITAGDIGTRGATRLASKCALLADIYGSVKLLPCEC